MNGAIHLLFQNALFLDQGSEATCAEFFDHDGDGDLDLDLLIGHGGNEFHKGIANFGLRIYTNDGKGQFTSTIGQAPSIMGNLSCIRGAD